ncbi:hypothetical protein GJ496_004992, partial [Pomphorhynchus laevis]
KRKTSRYNSKHNGRDAAANHQIENHDHSMNVTILRGGFETVDSDQNDLMSTTKKELKEICHLIQQFNTIGIDNYELYWLRIQALNRIFCSPDNAMPDNFEYGRCIEGKITKIGGLTGIGFILYPNWTRSSTVRPNLVCTRTKYIHSNYVKELGV